MVDNPRPPNTNKQASGVTIGNVEGGIHGSTIAGGNVFQRITQVFAGSSDEQRAMRNRRAMLELVRNTWVKGVLEQSLHGAAMIELGLEERAEAVEHPWDMIVQQSEQPTCPLPPGTSIISVFEEMNCALLILGEPGSGKTTMLLELARDTIARAQADSTQPMPVVFNLSSWAEKRQPLVNWLVEELNTKYNIPKRVAQPWVENDELMLLLDGLDEVKLEYREACVQAINEFRQEHGLTPLVVCSRIADYEALVMRLRLQGAVLLLPLTPEQIDRYLEVAGIELLAVHQTLQHDATLQELAQSPLMLSIMTLAYKGISIEDLQSLNGIMARREHLFDTYVQKMFTRRRIEQLYSRERTIRWLAWLARTMRQHAQSVFLIERIQSSWLQTLGQRIQYVITTMLIGAIAGGSYGVLIGWLVGENRQAILYFVGPFLDRLSVALVYGLFYGGVGVLVGGFIAGTKITPVEALNWSRNSTRRALIGILVTAAYIGLSFLVTSHSNLPRVNPKFALSAGLGFGLVVGLALGLRGGELKEKTVPNQGILESAKKAAILGLIGGLSGGLIGGWVLGTWRNMLIQGWMYGFILTLIFGGTACVKHFALRFVLWLNGCAPLNYTHFLDYAAERIFLRKVGGGYTFVHRLLMEYFSIRRL